LKARDKQNRSREARKILPDGTTQRSLGSGSNLKAASDAKRLVGLVSASTPSNDLDGDPQGM